MSGELQNLISLYNEREELLKKNPKPKIGILSNYVPEEIIYAMGLLPVKINGDKTFNRISATSCLHHCMCSYVLDCFDEAANHQFDYLDGVVIANACDARRCLFDAWKHYLDPKFIHFLDIPKLTSEKAVEFFKHQIELLIEHVQDSFSVSFNADILKEAVKLYNESRILLKKFDELYVEGMIDINAYDYITIVKASSCGLNDEFNLRMRAFLENVGEQKAVCNYKNKTLVVGCYFDNMEIIDILESIGVKVMVFYNSNGFKKFDKLIDTDQEPLNAVAKYYISRRISPKVLKPDYHYNKILSLIKKYDINSVLFFTLKFCDNNMIDEAFLKMEMKKHKIPVLSIDSERNQSTVQNIKTRIQTFYELYS